MRKLFLLIVGLLLITLSCQYIYKGNGQNPEYTEKAKNDWARIKSEPSHNLSGVSRNHLINHSIEINNSPKTINIDSEGFTGDLLFGNGNLKIYNSSLDLTPKYSIKFTANKGPVHLEKATLNTAFIENARITLESNTNMHLYSNNPLKESLLNFTGSNITIYFHGLSFSDVSQVIIASGAISINGKKITSVDDFNNYPEKEIGICTFKGGTELTIKINKQ